VEIVVKDTKGDAPTAQSTAEELIADTSIAAVVSASSGTESVVGKTLSDSGLPVVGGEGYNPTVWGALKNWFGITTTFPSVVNMQVASAQPVGGHTLSVVACAEDPSCVAAMPLFDAAAKAAGNTYAGTFKVAGAAPNYTAECLSLVKKNADFIQLSIAPAVGVRVVQDCQTQGYKGYFGSSAAGVTASLYDAPGIRLAGGLNGFPWWVDDAPVKHFREVMTAQKVAEKDWAQPTGTALWATGELFTKALTAAAIPAATPVTREAVLAAYGKISGETLDGLLPQPITFTADKPAPPVNCYWLYDFQNGAFKGSLTPNCPAA
jgi:branched-chain amino acid transport system substrate-binding protein